MGELSSASTALALTRLRSRSAQLLREEVRSLRAWARVARPGECGALPDFLILGGMRCGTTSLYHYLAEHPDVEPATGKELQYFTLHYRRGERWYRAHFPTAVAGRLSFEASPYYLFHPAAPARVASTLPGARFLILLRDPVERAYSHYLHTRRRGYEPLGFEDALRAEGDRLSNALSAVATRRAQNALRLYSYVARGQYAEQLERWFDCLPRESFQVMRSEDLFADTARVYAGVLDFLGLRRFEPQSWHTHRSRGHAAPMDEHVRARLRDHFAAHNEKLAALLGWSTTW